MPNKFSKKGKAVLQFLKAGTTPPAFAEVFMLPCGQCVGCRLQRTQQWAIRCVHENMQHGESCFITLTYKDEYLPKDQNLKQRDFTLFMKRLRKSLEPKKVRFFACGEYGEKNGRPHYHALIFNHDFEDKKLWSQSDTKTPWFTSKELQRLWPLGFSSLGAVSLQSSAYVARYILKKVNGYNLIKRVGQKWVIRSPEFITMSRAEGIGKEWYDKHNKEAYPDDFIVWDGKKMQVPAYYDKQLEEMDRAEYDQIKLARVRKARKHANDQTIPRLIAREICTEAKINQLPRKLEQ